MTLRILLFVLLGVDAAILILKIPDLSISYHEAAIFFEAKTLLHYIINLSTALLGQNDFALRAPMILLHVGSTLLLYSLAKPYSRYERDRLWLAAVYMLLPGVSSAAILVDDAGLVLFFLMLYLYLYQRYQKASFFLLPLLILVDDSFMLLYLGMTFYAAERREIRLLALYGILFLVTLFIYGFDVSGLPQGTFLDTLGIYATIFSPIIFFYLFYVLYRRSFFGPRDQLFYIATAALLMSLLFSFRQRIEVELFAPYLMAALPLAMQNFFHSYRIRLRPFRKKYRIWFAVALTLLILNVIVVFFHKVIYCFLPDASHHFAYRMHVAGELSKQLKAAHIDCLDTNNRAMQLRLKYYGITQCESYLLVRQPQNPDDLNVTIYYRETPIYSRFVTNIHK